jgi:periplasmic protein CpxP/Spy
MIRQKLLATASVITLTVALLSHHAVAQSTDTPGPAAQPTDTLGPAAPPANTPGPATQPTDTPGPAAQPTDTPGPAAQPTYTPGPVTDVLKELNLTPQQQPEVDKIQTLAAARIKGVLTPEQLDQLKVLADSGKADTEAFASLNLSGEQKDKLNEIQLEVGQQLFAVLTDEQRQKLIDAMMKMTQKK